MLQKKSSNTSNKTPSAQAEKTAWALKAAAITLVLVVAVVAAVPALIWLAAQGFLFWQAEKCEPVIALTTKKVIANGHKITAYETENESDRAQGLGGLKCIPENNAMLFAFLESSTHCFWMKDMKFAIDIIWLDGDKRVVHMEQDVKPETYPNSFCPSVDARYVLETNSGKAAGLGLNIGTQLEF